VPLNINRASAIDLEKLPGVGKVIAERIVSYRQENGPFRRAEHLMMVRGISETKFRAMQSMIKVEPVPQGE
jgi:competence protein ComEA